MIKIDPINVYPLPDGIAQGQLVPFAIEYSWGTPVYSFYDREAPGDIWVFNVRERYRKPWTRYRFGGEQINPYVSTECDGCGCK